MTVSLLRTFVLLLIFSANTSFANKPITVAFIVPTPQGDMFWDAFVDFMSAAADDLGMQLDIRYNDSGNRFGERDIASRLLNAETKPDFLLTQVKRNSFEKILVLSDQAKVPYFTINTKPSPEVAGEVGTPREKYPLWLGQMIPDDVQAGYELAERLIEEARKSGLVSADNKIALFAISGGRDSSAALDRNNGLMQAISQHNDVELKQLVFSGWDTQDARELAERLLARHPETHAVWAASDGIALGVIGAANASGKVPGKNLLTAGIDWSTQGIDAVESGAMLTTLGAHFMEGAWALVLLHDYYHGKDFADTIGTQIRAPFHAITQANVQQLKLVTQPEHFARIDFKTFSRVYNPELTAYHFGIEPVMSQLAAETAE